MGLNIGSNFNYQGENFLDSRQGLPKTLSDLVNWDILVPLGFEVCVGGSWYIYKGPDYWDPRTGHWQDRITLKDYTAEINKLMTAVFPASLEVSGSGTYEIGQSIIPTITWDVRKELAPVTPTKVTVDDVEVPNPESGAWTSDVALSNNHTYVVRVWTDEGATLMKEVPIEFKYKKFWGVCDNPQEFSSLAGLDSTWAEEWTMEATIFDCGSGSGKYPVYVLPESVWPESGFGIWVGGFKTSDFDVAAMTLQNPSGHSSAYKVVTLGTRQTGELSIEFKI